MTITHFLELWGHMSQAASRTGFVVVDSCYRLDGVRGVIFNPRDGLTYNVDISLDNSRIPKPKPIEEEEDE